MLGVPRGAVPMAKIIADALDGEFDVVLVHKLSHPEQPELAIGAIDEAGNAFVNDWAADLDHNYLEAEKKRQLAVLRQRRAAYTPWRQPIDPHGRIVIVVDDGIATGSTMMAALACFARAQTEKTCRRGRGGVAGSRAGDAARVRYHGLLECAGRVLLSWPVFRRLQPGDRRRRGHDLETRYRTVYRRRRWATSPLESFCIGFSFSLRFSLRRGKCAEPPGCYCS